MNGVPPSRVCPRPVFGSACLTTAALLICAQALAQATSQAPATPAAPAAKAAAAAAAPATPAAATTTPAARKPAGAGKAAGDGAQSAAASEKAKGSYSIGVMFGSQMHGAGLTGDSLATDRLVQGLRDALSGKVTASAQDRQNIDALLHTVQDNLGKVNHAAAASFLAENGKKPGVVTTASGLEYRVISAGSGASPKPTDQVTVNYRGSLLDGSEFDSSYKRGQPATFPVNGVIPGWQEALVLMKPGAKWELFVPPQLAYDMRAQPGIPPGSLLKFEVELIKTEAPPTPQPMPAMPDAKTPSPH
ncbi:MAG TPA: FKBP-type peptidyl-prolyl cis-trans isomerase [Steroidobacteraceae bacterium]|nr:FKBP-type peptidyl-prolyl cis-trans isomerase [Steroidobacteraceae bacterium]